MSQTIPADFAAFEGATALEGIVVTPNDSPADSSSDYMQPIPGSVQSDLGAYLAAPQPMTNTQGSSTPSRIGAPAPDDAPLLVGDTGVDYGPEIGVGSYALRTVGMGLSVPINGVINFVGGLWDLAAATVRPSERLQYETNLEYLDIDGSEAYPEPGSGLTFDKLGMALSASIEQSNENIRIAEASGNDFSVGWELGNHPLIQATGAGEFAGLSALSKLGKLAPDGGFFKSTTRGDDVFDLDSTDLSYIKQLNDVELNALRGAGLSDVEISRQIELLGDIQLFRGTSPGYPGNPALQKLGISPASTDPLVATVFGLESRSKGAEGVVLFGSRESFGAQIDMGNVRNVLEREVQVGLSPTEFAQRASNSIPVNEARQILADMGVANLPPAIRSTEEATRILETTPRLTPEQIKEFIFQAQNR